MKLVCVVFAVTLLSACEQSSQTTAQNPAVAGLEIQAKELNKEIQVLRSELRMLESDMRSLKQKVTLNDLMNRIEGVAYLTPEASGYSILKTDLGVLTVSLQNVQPYANGSKVTLRFGNVISATVNGLKGTVEWGSIGKDGSQIPESVKSREVQFAELLRPGSWTNVDVVLEGTVPAELGFVRVRDLTHHGIRLIGG